MLLMSVILQHVVLNTLEFIELRNPNVQVTTLHPLHAVHLERHLYAANERR